MKEIKPYYFYRCGILHKRVQLDYGIKLDEEDVDRVLEVLASGDKHKQRALAKEWIYQTGIRKRVPGDGVDMVKENLIECSKRNSSGSES